MFSHCKKNSGARNFRKAATATHRRTKNCGWRSATRPTRKRISSYLKGRYYWNKRTGEGFLQARDYFQQSIDKDPSYALAYAGLADAYAQLAFFNVAPPRDVMPKAKAAAMKALEIDAATWRSISAAWIRRIHVRLRLGRSGESISIEALELNQTYTRAHTFYPLYLSSLGRSTGGDRRWRSSASRIPIRVRRLSATT